MKRLVYYFFRTILRIRYKISIEVEKGLVGEIRASKKGKLFICNHMSIMDGVITGMAILKTFGIDYPIRAVMIGTIHDRGDKRLLPRLVDLFKPVLLPEFRYGEAYFKMDQVEAGLQEIAKGLREGDSFLFFPSGKLQYPNRPQMYNEKGLQKLLQMAPDIELVFLGIRGMWGSLFSVGYNGKNPPQIEQAFLEGGKIALKNGIFFAPKRPVTVTIARCPKNFPREGSVQEMCTFLNDWWGMEPRVLIPHYFYRKSLQDPLRIDLYRDDIVIGEEEKERYLALLLKRLNRSLRAPHPTVTATTNLKTALSIDSVEFMEILVAIDPHNSLGEIDLLKLETAEDLLALFFIRNRQTLLEKKDSTDERI